LIERVGDDGGVEVLFCEFAGFNIPGSHLVTVS
jgi:hypothetical protein